MSSYNCPRITKVPSGGDAFENRANFICLPASDFARGVLGGDRGKWKGNGQTLRVAGLLQHPVVLSQCMCNVG